MVIAIFVKPIYFATPYQTNDPVEWGLAILTITIQLCAFSDI